MGQRRWRLRARSKACCAGALFGITVLAVVATGPRAALGDDVPIAEPITTSAADVALLTSVSISAGDVALPGQIRPYQSGTAVRGQVSLDVCGAEFPSEALRIGRVQVGVYDGEDEVFAVEAVRYRDEAAAEQALTELLQAKRDCDRTQFAPSRVANQPPVRTRFLRVPRRFAPVAHVERVSLNLDITTSTRLHGRLLLVFQRVGSVVVGLYGAPSVADAYVAERTGGMAGLADVLAARLESARSVAR